LLKSTAELKLEPLKRALSDSKKPLMAEEFEFMQLLGEGSYAEVVKAKYKKTGKIYAIKIIHMKHMAKVLNCAILTKKARERVPGTN